MLRRHKGDEAPTNKARAKTQQKTLQQKLEDHFETLVVASVSVGIELELAAGIELENESPLTGGGPNYKARLAKTRDRWLRGYLTGYASYFISEDLWQNEEAREGLLYFFFKQLLGDSLLDPFILIMAREHLSDDAEKYRYGYVAGREDAEAFTTRKASHSRLLHRLSQSSLESSNRRKIP